MKTPQEEMDMLEQYQGLMVPPQLIPLTENVSKTLMARILEHATFPLERTCYAKFKEEMMGKLSFDWEYIHSMYMHVKEAREFGVTLKDLVVRLGKGRCPWISSTEIFRFLRTCTTSSSTTTCTTYSA